MTPLVVLASDSAWLAADVVAHVFLGDAPPSPLVRTRRRSTPSSRARRRTAGPAAADEWPSPGCRRRTSTSSQAWPARRRRSTTTASRFRRRGGDLRPPTWRRASSAGFGFLGFFLLVGDRFVELLFLDDVLLLRSGLRLLFLLLRRLGRASFLRGGAVARPPSASISKIAPPTGTVSPSATRILTILPACGLGTGIVALSVSSFEQVLILRDDVALAHEDRKHVARFNVLAERGKRDLRGHLV